MRDAAALALASTRRRGATSPEDRRLAVAEWRPSGTRAPRTSAGSSRPSSAAKIPRPLLPRRRGCRRRRASTPCPESKIHFRMNLSTNFASAARERFVRRPRPASSSSACPFKRRVRGCVSKIALPRVSCSGETAWHTTSVLADLCASTGIAASGARAPTAIPDRNLLPTRDQQRLRARPWSCNIYIYRRRVFCCETRRSFVSAVPMPHRFYTLESAGSTSRFNLGAAKAEALRSNRPGRQARRAADDRRLLGAQSGRCDCP